MTAASQMGFQHINPYRVDIATPLKRWTSRSQRGEQLSTSPSFMTSPFRVELAPASGRCHPRHQFACVGSGEVPAIATAIAVIGQVRIAQQPWAACLHRTYLAC